MVKSEDNQCYRWLAIILVVIVIAPYLIGFALQTEELYFSGTFIGVDDQNSYLAKMRYGNEGNWLFRSPYTNFPQNGIVVYFPFIFMGKLAGGENLVGQLQFLMLMLRVVGACFYVFALKFFFNMFFMQNNRAKIATVLTIFGGGFGFIYFTGLSSLWGSGLPLEFYSPEAFSFLALLTLPHIIIARSLLLIAITCWFFQIDFFLGKIRIRYEISAALCGYLIFLFQPIALPILCAIIGIYFIFQIVIDMKNKVTIKDIVRQKFVHSLVLFILVLLPVLAYNFYMLMYDPYVKVWGTQNALTTAPLIDYILAYGPFLLLTVYYFVKGNEISDKAKALGVWIIISLIGIYLPLSIQRRLIEGSWIFMILFTIMGIDAIKSKFWDSIKMRIGIFIFTISSLFLISGSILQVFSKPDRVFIDKNKIELFNFISETFPVKETVFANHEIGNEIPVWTHMTTITGVGPESINEPFYLAYYQDLMDMKIERDKFESMLRENEIKYYVLDNQNNISCNSLFENDDYLLCMVGDHE